MAPEGQTPEHVAHVRAIRRRCLGTLPDGRVCGADINDLICSHPFDGAAHEYTCARCGREGHFTSPRFDSPSAE